MNEQRTKQAATKKSNLVTDKWHAEINWENQEFDQWMTRQLNCLVGRHIEYATGSSTNRQPVGLHRCEVAIDILAG